MERILKYLINNYFPELKNQKIKLFSHNQNDSFAYTIGLPYFGFKIYFNEKDSTRLSPEEIKGILAHELAHISYDVKNGFIKSFLYLLKKNVPKEEVTKIERTVDRIVVEKGCGKYLLASVKYHDKLYKSYKKKDGLTRKEIKKMLNKNRP